MDKSLKIGIVSGLIAGFVAGIVYSISGNISASSGLYHPFYCEIIPKAFVVGIVNKIIFGVILGIIFSKIYNVVPTKGIWKGLIFGLMIFIITPFRVSTFWIAYGYLVAGTILQGFFTWILYGIVLGILYEFLCSKYHLSKEAKKITTYELKSGVFPGAIAGIVNGLISSIVAGVGPVIGLWMVAGGPAKLTFDLWWGLAGSHILMNLIWGTIFGIMFTKVYNFIPGKRIMKGLVYSLLLYLITSFQITTYFIWWATVPSAWEVCINAALNLGFIGFFGTGVAYGLALGVLYKR